MHWNTDRACSVDEQKVASFSCCIASGYRHVDTGDQCGSDALLLRGEGSAKIYALICTDEYQVKLHVAGGKLTAICKLNQAWKDADAGVERTRKVLSEVTVDHDF